MGQGTATGWGPPTPAEQPVAVLPTPPWEAGSVRREPGGAALGVPAGAGESAAGAAAGTRRRRVDGGRRRQINIRVTDVEFEQLEVRARAAGVSVPRLLVESVLARDGVTPPERRALYASFLAARRTLAGAANNLNQLTRWSHAHEEAHPEIDRATAAVEAAAARVVTAVSAVDRAVAGERTVAGGLAE